MKVYLYLNVSQESGTCTCIVMQRGGHLLNHLPCTCIHKPSQCLIDAKKKTQDKAIVVYSRFAGLHGRAELVFLAWSGRIAFVWQCLAACLARLGHVTERWTEQLVDGG